VLERFREWLKRSGINHTSKENVSYGQEMMDSLNPFDDFLENPEYPLARIYREKPWIGLIDTYEILVGEHYDGPETKNGRVGVLDILLFPLLGRRLVAMAYNTHYPLPLRVVVGAIGYLLELPRHGLAILATLCLSPIVAAVHAVTAIKAYFLRHQAEQLVAEFQDGDQIKSTPIAKLLSKNRRDLTDIVYNGTSVTPENETRQTYTLPKKSTSNTKTPEYLNFWVIVEKKEDKAAYEAFQALNVGARVFKNPF
jgi:hypothetical protein